MGRAEVGRRMRSREVSPPSENATSDEEEWPEPRASTSSIWPRGQSLSSNSSFEESFHYSDSDLPPSVISEDDLPVPGRQYEQETAQPEVHIWSAECEGKLSKKHERFLDEAYLERGIGQDQALALLFSFDFDLAACRKNIQRLKNANTPLLNKEQQECFQRLRQEPNPNKRFNDHKDFFAFHLHPLLSKFSVKELVNFYYHSKLAKLKVEVQFWVSTQHNDAQRRKRSLVEFLRENEKLKTRSIRAKAKRGKKIQQLQQKQRCDNCLQVRRELKQVEKVSKVRLCVDCVTFFAKHKRLMEVPVEVNEEALLSPPKRKCLAPPPTLPSPSSDKENHDVEIIHVQSRIRKLEAGRITEVITLD